MMKFNEKPNNDDTSLDIDLDASEGIQEANQAIEEVLSEPYTPPNQLHIPQEACDHYEAAGYSLQWIRIYVPNTNGALDSKNIIKKESDKYEFVPRKEIAGLAQAMTSFFGDEIDKGSHGLYIVGDLALAKVPHVRVAQKRRYNDRQTRLRSESILSELKKNDVMPSSDREEGWKIEQSRPKSKETSFG